MDDKDDIDDEDDDDNPRFNSNTSRGHPNVVRKVGINTGQGITFRTPSQMGSNTVLVFSISPLSSGGVQSRSPFSSSIGSRGILFDDFGEDVSPPTSLPPPPSVVKANPEGQGQPKGQSQPEGQDQLKDQKTQRELEMEIEELQAKLSEMKTSKRKEQLSSSMTNTDQRQYSDNSEYDVNVKGEWSSPNEDGEAYESLTENTKNSEGIVIENNVNDPFKSAAGNEVPISKLLKKDAYSKTKFNQEEFLNSVLSSPRSSHKRVSEDGEGTGAWRIPLDLNKEGSGVSSKDMYQRPKQVADRVMKGIRSDECFKGGTEWNVDSDEEGVFENQFHEAGTQQDVVEISLPPNPNIPHTRERKTAGYTYNEHNYFGSRSAKETDFKSNSIDNFQNQNIPGKTLSASEALQDNISLPGHSNEPPLKPLKYPDHSPLDQPFTTGNVHSTQLPPKRMSSQEMMAPSGGSSTLVSDLDEDENTGYHEFNDNNRTSSTNYKASTGNSATYNVSRYTSYMSLLQSLAETHGYLIKDVTPDGNCMFSAIVDQMRIQGNFDLTPNSLRKTAVDYLRDNPKNQDGTHLESFLSTETWDEYLKRMGQESQWGDHMVLQACTEVTGQQIVVFKPNANKTVLVPTSEESLENNSLTLGHIGESHFVSLRAKDWETNWPLMAHAHRAKMKEKQKLARKKIHKRKKSNKQGKTSTPIVSDKEDSTSASEQGETGSGTEATEPGGATQEVVTENEPVEDEDTEDEDDEAESADAQFQTTDDVFDLMSDDLDLVLHPVAIDANSGIPMPHLSFLLRQFVKPTYLYVDTPKNLTISFNSRDEDLEPYLAGSVAEGLCVQFIDFTNPEQPSAIASNTPTVIGVTSSTFVRSESEPKVNDMDLIADTTLTHPGYVHLVPVNVRLHINMVTHIEEKPFLAHLTISSMRDKTSKMLLSKTFSGYRCLSWPECAMEWFSRSRPSRWPSNEMMRKIRNTECLVMSRGHPDCVWPTIEFQFVFPKAEHILAKEALSDDQRHCFNAFKTLIDFNLRNNGVTLSTTHLKSVMYYVCETLPLASWGSNSGGCLLYLLDNLFQKLQAKNLPHYFISENNMVDHLDDRTLQVLRERVAVIRTFPVMALYHIMEHHELCLSWMASMVLDDVALFRRHRQFNRSVREAFVPAMLQLAKQFLYANKHQDGYLIAQDAYSELLMQDPEEDALGKCPTEAILDRRAADLRKILQDMIKKEPQGPQQFLAYHLDLAFGTSLLNELYQAMATDIKTIGHLIGKEAAGALATVPVPPNIYGDIQRELAFLDQMAHQFYKQRKLDQAVQVLRGGIEKGNRERLSAAIDVSDIMDSSVKKDIASQTYTMMTNYNYILAEMYYHLYVCYLEMNSMALFQEIIEDYEDLCDMIGLASYYKDVVKIWYKLGNVERSRQVGRKMKALSSSSSKFINDAWP